MAAAPLLITDNHQTDHYIIQMAPAEPLAGVLVLVDDTLEIVDLNDDTIVGEIHVAEEWPIDIEMVIEN